MSKYTNVSIILLEEPSQFELAYVVRKAVYVDEQGYAMNTVTDEDDHTAKHWVAVADRLNEDGTIDKNIPIGTVRLVIFPNNNARLGRVAVVSSARGLRVGPQLIQVFEEYCKNNGLHTIYLHAVSEKRGFYEYLGYFVEDNDDKEFEEDGTPHVRLWKRNLCQVDQNS